MLNTEVSTLQYEIQKLQAEQDHLKEQVKQMQETLVSMRQIMFPYGTRLAALEGAHKKLNEAHTRTEARSVWAVEYIDKKEKRCSLCSWFFGH
jgi:chromosome segregation ATPase